MTSLNWTKTRQNTSMRFNGAVDKATDREWRDNDRAARWLEKVEASQPKAKVKSKKRHKSSKRPEARENTV